MKQKRHCQTLKKAGAITVVLKEKGKFLEVACDCGLVKVVSRGNVLSGKTQSCGCFQRERTKDSNFKHGHSALKTPTYVSWQAMLTHCRNPNLDSAVWSKDRGISYDPRWGSFEVFLADMGSRPEGTELDRIDNNDGYFPENCRWATHQVNCQNRGY